MRQFSTVDLFVLFLFSGVYRHIYIISSQYSPMYYAFIINYYAPLEPFCLCKSKDCNCNVIIACNAGH